MTSWETGMETETQKESIDSSINVCFSTADGILAWLIRKCTRSPVSHALITYRSRDLDKIVVLEATGRGFGLAPWGKWEEDHTLVARFRLTIEIDKQRAALTTIAESLGADYDVAGLLGFLRLMWHKVKVWFASRWKRRRYGEPGNKKKRWRFRNYAQDPKKLFCSEAVAKFLFAAGFEELEHPEDWAPSDLLALARRHAGLVEVPVGENKQPTLVKMYRRGRVSPEQLSAPPATE